MWSAESLECPMGSRVQGGNKNWRPLMAGTAKGSINRRRGFAIEETTDGPSVGNRSTVMMMWQCG